MKYEEYEMKYIQFDENDVFASWLEDSGENMEVESVNPGNTDK